jgi:uncharacterized phage protein gp47/JayE
MTLTGFDDIPKLVLDPDDDEALRFQAIARTQAASNNVLTDWTIGSPLSALIEGEVFCVSELLWYLNLLPEALALEVLRLHGVSRSPGTAATGTLTFLLTVPLVTPYVLNAGYQVNAGNGTSYTLTSQLYIAPGALDGTVTVEASTLGSAGNVGAYGLSVAPALNGVQAIYNVEPLTGGTDLEPLESLLARAQLAYRTRGALVSASDFEEHGQSLLGTGSKVICVPLLTSNKLDKQAGNIHLFLVGADGKPPSFGTCQSIRADMLPLVFAGASLWVSPVALLPINLEITCKVEALGQEQAQNIYEAVKTYLSPLNLPIGSAVSLKNLEYMIRSVPGTLELGTVLINREASSAQMPEEYYSPDLQAVSVALIDPSGFEDVYYFGDDLGDQI